MAVYMLELCEYYLERIHLGVDLVRLLEKGINFRVKDERDGGFF